MFEINSVVFEELLGKIQHEILNFFTFVRLTFYNHKYVKKHMILMCYNKIRGGQLLVVIFL